MRIEHLKSFVVVAHEKSFTRASQILFIAQPAITRHIAAVEKEVGAPLLKRTTRQVELTDAGESFLQKAQMIIDLEGEAKRDARAIAFSQKEAIRIGYNYLYMDSVTTPWLKEFKEAKTEVAEIIITEAAPEQLVEQLEKSNLDGAFVGVTNDSYIPGNLEKLKITCLGEKILVGMKHPLARKKSLCVEDLKGEQFVYPFREPSLMSSLVRCDLRDRGYEVEVIQTEFENSAIKMVELGEAVIDLPSPCPVPSGSFAEIPYISGLVITYYFAWNPKNEKPCLRDLVEFLAAKIEQFELEEA